MSGKIAGSDTTDYYLSLQVFLHFAKTIHHYKILETCNQYNRKLSSVVEHTLSVREV